MADASDGAENWAEDPGWRLDRRVFMMLIPGGMQWQARRTPRGDTLTAVRNHFASFTGSLVVFGVVLAFVPAAQYGSGWAPALMVLAVAVITITVGNRVERPLDCSSDTKLAGSYQARFFLRMAFAETTAMIAFALYFVNGPWWIYYLGAAISLARMASRAPTSAALVRDQDALVMEGCARSLVTALRHPRD